MTETPRPAPYPADTKAKGWRFELDLEQVMQSDTWALAAQDERPWLFMLWATAWQQTPCGSMPSEPKLICARLGMSTKQFSKSSEVLLRGWWLADDGRLYHDTIASRVLDMLNRKSAERQRKADYRAKKEAEERLRDINAKTRDALDVPHLSHGTDTGQTWDSTGSDATGTGTGTGTGLGSSDLNAHCASACEKSEPLTAGEVSKAMRLVGLSDAHPGHQTLKALIDAGATLDEFTGAAATAKAKSMGFVYALGIVRRDREQAAQIAAGLLRGPLPSKSRAPAAENFETKTYAGGLL